MSETRVCPECNGHGFALSSGGWKRQGERFSAVVRSGPCLACHGSGRVWAEPIWAPAARAYAEGKIGVPPRSTVVRPESTWEIEPLEQPITRLGNE